MRTSRPTPTENGEKPIKPSGPMTPRMDIEELEKYVWEKIPKTCQVSNVDFEGPEIVLYTKNPKAFFAST